jgi:hypothetical protein
MGFSDQFWRLPAAPVIKIMARFLSAHSFDASDGHSNTVRYGNRTSFFEEQPT